MITGQPAASWFSLTYLERKAIQDAAIEARTGKKPPRRKR